MALPTSKQPLPGFRLIADDAGSYIDDVNNIRLGPEFVLSRNAADPSASISVAQYIQNQIAAAIVNTGSVAGRLGIYELIDMQTVTGTTYTSPTWSANKYRSLKFECVSISGCGTSTITLTGISGTYTYGIWYITGSAGSTANDTAWVGGSTAPATFRGDILCPTGGIRSISANYYNDDAGGPYKAFTAGVNTDTTHDITGLVLTMAATGTFKMALWGIPN